MFKRVLMDGYSKQPITQINGGWFFVETKKKSLVVRSPFSLCTDWLCEAIAGSSPYNKTYGYKTTEKYQLAYSIGIGFVDTFTKNFIPFLHKLEQKNGFKKTRYVLLPSTKFDQPGLSKDQIIIVLYPDRRWLSNTLLVSLYTKIMRNGYLYKEPITTPEHATKALGFDKERLLQGEGLLFKILSRGKLLDIIKNDTTPHGLPSTTSPCHGNLGIQYTLVCWAGKEKLNYTRVQAVQQLADELKGVPSNEMSFL